MLLTLRMVMHSDNHFVGDHHTLILTGGRIGRNTLMG